MDYPMYTFTSVLCMHISIGTLSKEEVQEYMSTLEKRFKNMKKLTREGLEKHQVSVKAVVESLTDLSADDMPDHKMFLQSNLQVLFDADNHYELFGSMNFYWGYLSYHLLDHLIQEFKIDNLKEEMKAYKQDIHEFIRRTSLVTFCQLQKRRRVDPPPGFRKVIAEHHWPDTVTLEVVEAFRQEYACEYGLRKCAMMLVSCEIGSFLVTWFVPESVVERLSGKDAGKVFEKHRVRKLVISGVCVFSTEHNVSAQYCMHNSPIH